MWATSLNSPTTLVDTYGLEADAGWFKMDCPFSLDFCVSVAKSFVMTSWDGNQGGGDGSGYWAMSPAKWIVTRPAEYGQTGDVVFLLDFEKGHYEFTFNYILDFNDFYSQFARRVRLARDQQQQLDFQGILPEAYKRSANVANPCTYVVWTGAATIAGAVGVVGANSEEILTAAQKNYPELIRKGLETFFRRAATPGKPGLVRVAVASAIATKDKFVRICSSIE